MRFALLALPLAVGLDCATSDFPPPVEMALPSPSVKRAILQSPPVKGTRRCFVETGMDAGDTTVSVAQTYARVHSVEKADQVYLKGKKKFARQPHLNITAYHGDTLHHLPAIMAMQPDEGRCVFYLDAHNTAGIKRWGFTPTNPIIEELSILLSSPQRGDMRIIIDDYRQFGVYNPPKNNKTGAYYAPYPSPSDIQAHVCKEEPKARFIVAHDMMHVCMSAPCKV